VEADRPNAQLGVCAHVRAAVTCAALARTWYVADGGNKRRIEAAFPHLLEDFGPDSAYFYLQNH